MKDNATIEELRNERKRLVALTLSGLAIPGYNGSFCQQAHKSSIEDIDAKLKLLQSESLNPMKTKTLITVRHNGQKFIKIGYNLGQDECFYPVENLRWLSERTFFYFVKGEACQGLPDREA